MAKYRTEQMLNAEDATTATTKIIDLDVSEPISRLVIEYKGTNNLAVPTAHGAKMVTKLEIVDGSDILYSLSGIEAQAINYYDTGHLPLQTNEYRNDVMNIQTFDMSFGRYLWDDVLALNPARFRNLQLRITHNKALGGSTPDASTMSVFADLFDEKKINPIGFLQNKEHFTYSLTSSAAQTIDLPTDLPMRKLIVQSLAAGKQPWEQYNLLKLSEDDGKKVPLNDVKTSSLLNLLRAYPRIMESIEGTGTGSAQTTYCATTYETYAAISSLDTALASLIAAQSYGGTIAVTADNTEFYQSVISGMAPHGALAIPFGKQEDINDWYDLTNVGSLKLKVTAGSSVGSSSTAQILTQQLRRY